MTKYHYDDSVLVRTDFPLRACHKSLCRTHHCDLWCIRPREKALVHLFLYTLYNSRLLMWYRLMVVGTVWLTYTVGMFPVVATSLLRYYKTDCPCKCHIKVVLSKYRIGINKCVQTYMIGLTLQEIYWMVFKHYLKKEVPRAVQLYCNNHRLNLILVNVIKSVEVVDCFFLTFYKIYILLYLDLQSTLSVLNLKKKF